MFKEAIYPANAAKALGPYSPAVKLGDFVYLSGQLGLDPKSGELIGQDIESQTIQVLRNIEAILATMYLESRHIVKTTVYLSDMADFAKMNEIYASFFEEPYPARSTVQVAALPKNAKVEIECLVIDTLAYEYAQGCSQDCEAGCGCSGCSGE